MKKAILPVAVLATLQVLSSCTMKKTPQVAAVEATPPKAETAERAPTSQEESPWTTWSKKGTVGALLVLKGMREDLLKHSLHDPHVDYAGYAPANCTEHTTRFRSADGTCYYLDRPHVGAAGVAFGRNVRPDLIDHDAAEKLETPDPKLVSNTFFTRDEFKPVPFLNMLAASWIQFMNHDWLSHGKNAEENPFRFRSGDEVERTVENDTNNVYKREFGKVSINKVTHWWDGSQIYGSNQEEQNAVRSFTKGKLRTEAVNGRELLPKNAAFDPRNNRQNQGQEITGFADNWWVGLSMLHVLFVKEHNYIADQLMKKNVTYNPQTRMYTWKNGREKRQLNERELDEQVFQTARLINAALMAKIHTVEWTPAILANKTLKRAMFANWYGLGNPTTWTRILRGLGLEKADWGIDLGYTFSGIVGGKTKDYGVPYSITEEFTSVYRLHSLLPEELHLKRLDKKSEVNAVPFANTRNEKSYQYMANYDLKDLFYSFGTQHPGQLVLNNFPKFMQQLEIPGLPNMDLALVDIIRDRERGVPRYNQFRRGIGLKPIQRYEDFFMDGQAKDERQREILKKFRTVYGVDEKGNDNVEAIDLLVGTSAEEVRPKNFGFGETMFQIFIVMASRRLMTDRFFTENYNSRYYTKFGIKWIDDEGWMHKVILRHMPQLAPHLRGLETAFNPWNP